MALGAASGQVGLLPPAGEIARFYQATMVGLGLLEARSGTAMRFGPDADARWNAFRGGLKDWDRLELLVRDAAVRFPTGFAPRVVFDLAALADDEPCGPDWPGPEPGQAKDLLLAAAAGPRELSPGLEVVAGTWGLKPRMLPSSALANIEPTTKFLLCGAGAVLAAAALFNGRTDLDLADQAVLVADDPGTRQLFGLALAWLGTLRPARLVRSSATPEVLGQLGLVALDQSLVSEDVDAGIRERAMGLARTLGARG